MKLLKLTLIILISVLLLNGCTIKKTDNSAVRTLKHTVNSPIYLGIAVEKASEFAVVGTVTSIAYTAHKTKEGISSLISNEHNKTQIKEKP